MGRFDMTSRYDGTLRLTKSELYNELLDEQGLMPQIPVWTMILSKVNSAIPMGMAWNRNWNR